MAQTPRKNVIQNIIKNLVDSEIPGIQAVVKELSEWTKQLEERSWKIQHYASEIEEVAAEAEMETPEEASLADLVKNLEKTLAQLRQKPEANDEEQEPVKAKPVKTQLAEAVPVEAEPAEAEQGSEEVPSEPVEPVAEKEEAVEEELPEPAPRVRKSDGIGSPKMRDKFGLRGLRQTAPYTEPAPKGEEGGEEPQEDSETYITPEGFIVKRARK
jgi:translation initiation factor 2B subunit (eIF-2B alpha/beta/delta family)